MKYNGIVERKLRIIEENVEAIKGWNIDSFSVLKNDIKLQYAVERALQIIIEAIIDVSERILAMEKDPPSGSSAETIEKLQEKKIIDSNPEYIEMVKFRNFIVHRYENIDSEILYGVIKNKLSVFLQFVNNIRRYFG